MFSAENLPYAAFDELVDTDSSTAINGSGTWRLERSGSDVDSLYATVVLRFTRLAGEPTTGGGGDLSALRQDDGTVFLFFFYIDQGNSWTSYEKCDTSTAGICPATR